MEVIARQWKVFQTVRERFSCRECETITQPPAPFHVTPRGGGRAEWLRPARPSHGELACRVKPMVAEERTAPQKGGFRTLPSLPLPRRKLRLMPARLQVDA